MNGFTVLCALLASTVSAHMQMSNPFPIRSPLNNENPPSLKDYSYTNPLSPTGSDFPCKGYSNDPFRSMADYNAGEKYQMDLSGTATHTGGSCQISLSYDKGKSFKVIKSILESCPLARSYDFEIPSDAPSGQALLAWTWFNRLGNTEMYMNCAQVTIHSHNRRRWNEQKPLRKLEPTRVRRSSFNDLPPIFIANVNGQGQCTTIEMQPVKFPLPGDNVEGQTTGPGYTCKSWAPFLGHKFDERDVLSKHFNTTARVRLEVDKVPTEGKPIL